MDIKVPIGTTGLWNINAPFNDALQVGVPYTLVSIRLLSEIIAADGDPENDYYTANGISSSIYEEDIINNVAILSLQNDNGTILHIPSSFFASYPDIGGVPYRVMALTINIGAIPDTMSLVNIMVKIQSDVLETLGIDAIVKPIALSPITMLNSNDALAVETARVAKVSTALTDYTKYLKVSADLASARQKISLLEQYIKQNKDKLDL